MLAPTHVGSYDEYFPCLMAGDPAGRRSSGASSPSSIEERRLGRSLALANMVWGKTIANMAAQSNGPGADHVLALGGRIEDYTQAYDGEKQRNLFGGRIHFFSEKLATKHDSMTGQWFDGMGKYELITSVLGESIDKIDADFPLKLVTYKISWHSQMHTIRYPWLVSVQPENFVEMNPVDAQALNLCSGDRCRVSSASHPAGVIGRVLVTHTVAPGVIAVSHHFGHWEMSSRPSQVNGQNFAHDTSRGDGINSNLVMRADPSLPDVTLQDKIGGSSSFYDTRVKVQQV